LQGAESAQARTPPAPQCGSAGEYGITPARCNGQPVKKRTEQERFMTLYVYIRSIVGAVCVMCIVYYNSF